MAHYAARRQLYPRIFQTAEEQLSFEDVTMGCSQRGQILDGEMGVDRIVRVTVRELHAPLVFTVQERFRRTQYAHFRDITITEWNHASGSPSELYKITAGLFLYGYFDDRRCRFADAICVNVTDTLMAIASGKLLLTWGKNVKQQTFIACTFDDLDRAGLIRFRLSRPASSGLLWDLRD